MQDFPNKKSATLINNLVSGFAKLNEYSSKISEGVTPFCSCGEIETVEHFVLKCSRYEEARERLIDEFYFKTGLILH